MMDNNDNSDDNAAVIICQCLDLSDVCLPSTHEVPLLPQRMQTSVIGQDQQRKKPILHRWSRSSRRSCTTLSS